MVCSALSVLNRPSLEKSTKRSCRASGTDMVKKSKMVSIDVAAESKLASACKWVSGSFDVLFRLLKQK